MAVQKEKFGETKDGVGVTKFTITNGNGMSVSVLDYGAVIQALCVPDRNGKVSDIVLGFDDVAGYEVNACFFGAFIGRHGNRIGDAKFTLNDTTYELEKNDGRNNLHGGTPGWHQVMYHGEHTDDTVIFERVSPSGEQGYPGAMEVHLEYKLTDDNELILTYRTRADEDTLCNLTNHSYFNLKGHDGGDITDHEVQISATGFTETTEDLIPTGNIIPLEGTPLDFTAKKKISDDIGADYKPLIDAGGYDHNFALKKADGEYAKVGEVSEESSGRKMEIYTDLPGMQLYTGNFIEHEDGKGGTVYTKRTGVCFETQYFPNSINIPSFKPCIAKKGEEIITKTAYKFSW